MNNKAIVECVPNFSEGRNMKKIKLITDEIVNTEGVKLLDVDPGKATNRTVVTFVGHPDDVIKAAFKAIKKAGEVLDMSQHEGEHPRMGATDVCPLIPISGISLDETAEYAKKLGKMVGEGTNIPVYLYEAAANSKERENLATIRSGEYEGLEEKLKDPNWQPDHGTNVFNAKAGSVVIGARDFLVAYNINLNTTSVRRANSIAFDIREKGRLKRENGSLTGKVLTNNAGEELRTKGACTSVKAIGWYIEEYGIAQISMNLTDIKTTPLHEAFEECRKSANKRGLRVTGSELVGLVPKKVMIDAGKYFLKLQNRSVGIPDEEIIHIAIKSLGLDELSPFDPKKKIIEYLLEEDFEQPLLNMTLKGFADAIASENPAPGGGSVSAYVGAMGISLGTMVANLSSHKRGWDDQWEHFSDVAERGQALQVKLLNLIDEDTKAFNEILMAFRMAKNTAEEKQLRNDAVQSATKNAILTPFAMMEVCLASVSIIEEMVEKGIKASVSDGGVGMLCLSAAAHGAWMNVQINMSGLKDKDFAEDILTRGKIIIDRIDEKSEEVKKLVLVKL